MEKIRAFPVAMAFILAATLPAQEDLARWVDPFIGTKGVAMAVVCHSVPEEYRSLLWEATVNGQTNGVAKARTCDPPFDKNFDFGGEYAFMSFDMSAPVMVTLRPKTIRNLSHVRILPESAPVTVRHLPNGALELSVAQPCRFSVEPDGRRNPLLVFANPPERNAPDESDPKVKVYGPGTHTGGTTGYIHLKDGETLYLKAGAFVKGGVHAHGKGIRICGRGVLDSSDWAWKKGPTGAVVYMKDCQRAMLEGITVLGASRWTVVPKNCDDVTISNVKICGGRVQNDDGINPCNSRNVLIEDCFIRTDDDCIAAKGLDLSHGNCENVTVRNCVLWCDRARVVLLGHESRAPYMRNFLFENCDVVHFQMPVFLLEPGENMCLENIRVKDIRINTDVLGRTCRIVSASPLVNKYMRTKVPGHIINCSFENISVTGERSNCRFQVKGYDENHRTRNVSIVNASLYGVPVRRNDPSCCIGDFADNITVK